MRTRPGSIIRECYDGAGGSRFPVFKRGWIGCTLHTVHRTDPHQATTTQGYKIRSWIVVKE